MSSFQQRFGLPTDLTPIICHSVLLLVHPFSFIGRCVRPISHWLRIQLCLLLCFFAYWCNVPLLLNHCVWCVCAPIAAVLGTSLSYSPGLRSTQGLGVEPRPSQLWGTRDRVGRDLLRLYAMLISFHLSEGGGGVGTGQEGGGGGRWGKRTRGVGVEGGDQPSCYLCVIITLSPKQKTTSWES